MRGSMLRDGGQERGDRKQAVGALRLWGQGRTLSSFSDDCGEQLTDSWLSDFVIVNREGM